MTETGWYVGGQCTCRGFNPHILSRSCSEAEYVLGVQVKWNTYLMRPYLTLSYTNNYLSLPNKRTLVFLTVSHPKLFSSALYYNFFCLFFKCNTTVLNFFTEKPLLPQKKIWKSSLLGNRFTFLLRVHWEDRNPSHVYPLNMMLQLTAS